MTTKGKRPTILVVDDESAIRETLGMILKHSGFEVTLAGPSAKHWAALSDGSSTCFFPTST